MAVFPIIEWNFRKAWNNLLFLFSGWKLRIVFPTTDKAKFTIIFLVVYLNILISYSFVIIKAKKLYVMIRFSKNFVGFIISLLQGISQLIIILLAVAPGYVLLVPRIKGTPRYSYLMALSLASGPANGENHCWLSICHERFVVENYLPPLCCGGSSILLIPNFRSFNWR